MEVKVSGVRFYPEEFRRKLDAEKYQAKGTCEIHLALDHVELDLKNVTYRIDHEGKILLKPPFRIHSNKKAGIKPKLVPSVVFKDPLVWEMIEQTLREALEKGMPVKTTGKTGGIQLNFLEKLFDKAI